MNPQDLKLIVKDKYGQIAGNNQSCCGSDGCCDSSEFVDFSDNYSHLKGYNSDADMGLGCGLPTEFARIKEGDYVLDLGSGAGNDCFVARTLTGESGKVTGLDFTKPMVEKAKRNLVKTGFKNMEFVQGDIEEMPFSDDQFDVIISNCVLNLVPDKQKAFSEIFRVLKPGGHFSISDVVIVGELPEQLKKEAELYAGCITGAIQKEDYINLVKQKGFTNLTVQKEKAITLSDEVLSKHLNDREKNEFKASGTGIFSITLFARNPLL